MLSSLESFARSRVLSLLLKVALTAVAFGLVLRDIDLEQLHDIVVRQEHSLLLVAALLVAAQVLLGGFRWHRVVVALSGGQQHVFSQFQAQLFYYISVFFNCCLPGTVGGDVIRAWLAKSEHVPISLAAHSVIIDRLLALLALALIAVATLPIMGDAAGFNGYWGWPMALLAGAFAVYGAIRTDRWLQRFQSVRLVRWLLYFMHSIRLMMARPAMSSLSLFYALVAHLCYCLCAYVLAGSMHVELSFLAALTFVPLVLLLATLPISIGGWGVREAAMVSLLALVQVPQEAALMLSIQLGLMNMVVSLPAGLLWLVYRKQNPTPPEAV